MILLQIIDTLVTSSGELITEEKTSIVTLMMKGGIILIPIVILSLIAVYIFIERYFTIKKAATMEPAFMANIRDMY